MDFFKKYLIETIQGINGLIELNESYVNVRKIRTILEVEPSNKTKINFYWRNLQLLEQKKILKLHSRNRSKVYKLPNSKIDIEKLLKKLKLHY